MPVRNMIYDGLAYTSQMNQIWEQRSENREKMSDAEFLSRFPERRSPLSSDYRGKAGTDRTFARIYNRFLAC